MKIFTAQITFDPIEDLKALRAVVERWYPKKQSHKRYAVVGDRLIVANSLSDDTDDVLAMVAFIGNTFNRRVNIHFDELNFQNEERVATTPSDNSASADGIG